MKGDAASYSVFLVILTAAAITVIIAVLYHWIDDILPKQASQFTCTTKLLNFCVEYQKRDWHIVPYNYYEKNPKECEIYTGVSDNSNPSRQRCEEALGL